MTLTAPSRITGYIMKSGFNKPILATINGKDIEVLPTVCQGKIGVKLDGWFIPASKIEKITA